MSRTGIVADPQVELEFLAREGGHRGERFLGRRRVGGRNREARAVASEHEWKRPAVERVGDGRDRAGADHVDRLVATLGDGFRRADDVSETDHPVVRQWPVVLRPHGVGETVENRDGLVEVARHLGRLRADAAHTIANTDPARQNFEQELGLDQRTGSSAERNAPGPARSIGSRTPWPPTQPPARSAPSTTLAAMALDSVQPVPCRFLEASSRRGEAANGVLCHQKIDCLVAFKMTALHQNRARAELQQRLALTRHVGFASRDRLPEQRGRFGEVGRQAIDERQQLTRTASTKPAPLSASPEEAIMTGS